MVSTITRVTDKKHHVTDVLAGGLLGLLFAGAAFALLAEQRCHYKDENDASESDADEGEAEERGQKKKGLCGENSQVADPLPPPT